MSAENRQSKRVAMTHVMVKVATPERLKSSYLKDLSEGGLFVRADKPLPVGRQIMIDLLPPGWAAPLRISGTVQRVSGPPNSGMGVKFEDNTPEVQAQLKALIDEYSNHPAVEEAPDSQGQLQQLLSSYSDLQTSLQSKTVELETERSRRDEAQRRILELSAELELARNGSSPSSSDGASEALKAELQVARAEATELRTAMAEREGELEAYKRELAQLEADEAASRRLATMVAREKTDFQNEIALLRTTVTESENKLKLAASEQQVLRAEASGLQQQHESLVHDVARLQGETTDLSRQLSSTQKRLDASEQKANEFQTRATSAESQLAVLKGEAAAAQRRASTLEANLKESNERVHQLKTKERELRDLLSMVSKEGGGAPAPAGPPASSQSVFISTMEVEEDEADDRAAASSSLQNDIESELQRAEPASSPSIEIALSTSSSVHGAEVAIETGPSVVITTPTTRDSALNFDVDTDEAPPSSDMRGPAMTEPTPAQREQLEQRLRQNEALVKTSRFDAIEAPDETIKNVKGLMEAGGRLSELMVLGRGLVTPPELVRGLVYLIVSGALRFEGDR